MQIDIQARGFKLTEAIRQHTERRLRFAMGSTQYGPKGISVRLSDENGPRGGVDKLCFIQVTFPGASPVVIEDVQSNLYTAIDRAADRAGRTVARRLRRMRQIRRSTGDISVQVNPDGPDPEIGYLGGLSEVNRVS